MNLEDADSQKKTGCPFNQATGLVFVSQNYFLKKCSPEPPSNHSIAYNPISL